MGPHYKAWGNRSPVAILDCIVMSPCGEYCSTCCEIKEALPAKVTDAVYDNLCRGEGDAALVSLVNQLRILLTDDPETTGLTGGKDEKARQLKILSAHVKVSYPLYNEVEFRNTYKDDMQKIPDQPIFMWPNQEGEEELVTITAPEKRRKLRALRWTASSPSPHQECYGAQGPARVGLAEAFSGLRTHGGQERGRDPPDR